MVKKAKDKKKSRIGDTEWQLQEAKAMFSEVIQSAALKPQVITVRGKKKAVIISYDEYQKLKQPNQNLYELFRDSPLYGVELALPVRETENIREINL